jgi:hypothetical protein
MKLLNVLQSINAWKKLSLVNMKPRIALEVLRFNQRIADEHAIILKKQAALVAGVPDANEDTPEVMKLNAEFNEFLSQDSSLTPIYLTLNELVGAVDEKDETLTIQDLAFLEPFFKGYVDPATKAERDA